MTQDESWQQNYEEVMNFLKTNKGNLSKYDLTERRLFTWLKHNRKQMNQELLKKPRLSQFKELLELSEQYKEKESVEVI